MQIIIQNLENEFQAHELLRVFSEQLPQLAVNFSQNGHSCTLFPSIEKPLNVLSCFYVKYKDRYVKIAVNEILWVEGNGSSVKIITENKEYVGMVNLLSFLKQVNHPALLRIHKSYVVNKCKLAAFDNGAVYIMYKGDEKILAIGASYRDEFKKHVPRLMAD